MINGRIALWLGLVAALCIGHGANAAPPTPPKACQNAGSGCAGSMCLTSIAAAQASVPVDACPFGAESQNGVDVFSWNEFIAVNWPATQTCDPDTTKSILDVKSGSQGPVVWQTQMTADDLFVAPGQNPAAWCSGKSLAALFAKQPIELLHTAQTAAPPQALQHLASVIRQPTDVTAVGGVITDQSGRWLRFERLTNKLEYDQIVANKWYQLSVLNSLNPPQLTLPVGSIEFKSAWKILTPAEIAGGRYYTTQATVYNTPDGAKSPGANPVTLGLVGLHIIHKTQSQAGFFWSTFEQVDNDKVFFNRHGTTGPYNKQTAKKPYTELDQNGKPINAPVQITRLHKIAADPGLNAYYQKLLAGSVFANYRLVSTQWQTGLVRQGTPPNVANIVIETYVQNAQSKPQAASALPADFFPPPPPGHPAVGAAPSTGCLACHLNATVNHGKINTDHSFLFLDAQ
jgi:hypothetical protein